MNAYFLTIWAYILIFELKNEKKISISYTPPYESTCQTNFVWGGTWNFFQKKKLSCFYSSNQNVRSNRKKKSCLFWRSTNGLVVISLRNRPLKPFASGLFRRLIMTKPLVLHQKKGDFFNDLSVHSTWTIKNSKILTSIFTDCKGPPYNSLRFERVSEIFSHLKKFLKKTWFMKNEFCSFL